MTANFTYVRDHLGNVREKVDNSGAVQCRYAYDPWGRRTKTTGGSDAEFGFTGHYYHARSGLHLAFYRAYSAEMGRWISRDPIAERGALNIYGYVGNSPIVYFDPLGLWQFTGSIDLGVGVYLSFGKNSGQWNMCVKGGLGAGLSGSIDFMDSGQKKSGFCPITVAGTVGAGILGAGGEAGMNPNGLYGSASGRAGPATVGGGVSIASPNAPPTYSKTAGYTNLGASLFVGTGWQL